MNNKTHAELCFMAALDLARYWGRINRKIAWQWVKIAERCRGEAGISK